MQFFKQPYLHRNAKKNVFSSMGTYRGVKDGNKKMGLYSTQLRQWPLNLVLGGKHLIQGGNKSGSYQDTVQYSTMVQNFTLPQLGQKRFLAFCLLDFRAV